MSLCVRCQVLEVPSEFGARVAPRDLLPWADPYIAVLMQRLEQQYEIDWESNPLRAEDSDDMNHSTSQHEETSWTAAEVDGWQAPAEASHGWYPPVYGGWPLLDDLEDGGDDSAL
jgi:hypothetical protein